MKTTARVLALALLLAGCVEGQTSTTTTTEQSTTSTVATTATPPMSTNTPSPSTTTVPVTDPDTALGTFRSWTELVAAGEVEKAWNLLAPSSQEALGSMDAFADLFPAMHEGWAAWSQADDLEGELLTGTDGREALVVRATVTREGITEHAEARIPIYPGEGGILLSPFEDLDPAG